MAASLHCHLVLLLLGFSAFALPALAGRGTPASSDKKEPDCYGVQEGTVLIPGIGRYELGSHELPAVGGLDSSGPAARSAQFLPGIDDTFVPNPGLEIPNPFQPATP
ncbi:putative cell wall protein [Curcuma longa]|uniref:putative cell wall protein n=1 Tax=Curcuma longa TaxID=136217 RepID=UPI003D9E2F4A